jgi:DNA-binding transcriptional MerR regulator
MPDLTDSIPVPSTARLRSGTAARLAGVPVSTLRVWERRYGVVAAPKTATGQRLYSSHDVQRLRVLKQLTTSGHAIGTIAGLDLEALHSLAADAPLEAATQRRLVIVGRSAAQKLRAIPGCTAQAVHDDLDQALSQSGPGVAADVLLVHLPSLQPALADQVLAFGARLGTPSIIVVYAFGTELVAESLRAAGATVRREPATGRDLARLIAAARRPVTPSLVTSPSPVAPRRFSDEALVGLSERVSLVACECPRHVAELVMQLAGFERYSADCLSGSPADAALHRELSALAGTARAMFEGALERVMTQEGIELPARP